MVLVVNQKSVEVVEKPPLGSPVINEPSPTNLAAVTLPVTERFPEKVEVAIVLVAVKELAMVASTVQFGSVGKHCGSRVWPGV